MLDITANTPEFDPAYASQAAFRALMECMARPGDIRTLKGVEAPAPFAPATAALIRSLADYETPLWLDTAFLAAPKAAEWIRFHTGAPVVGDPAAAAFALIADAWIENMCPEPSHLSQVRMHNDIIGNHWFFPAFYVSDMQDGIHTLHVRHRFRLTSSGNGNAWCRMC